jgi:fibronectin type 3 domain-containing protein
MKPFTVLIIFPVFLLVQELRAPPQRKATLAWTQGTIQAGGCAITSNNIYRGTSSGGETLLVTTPAATSYTDSTVKSGNTYFYQVSAVSCDGESSRSAEVSAKIPGKPS